VGVVLYSARGMTDEDDSTLVQKIRDGDRLAWDQLYRRHQARLLRMARVRTRDESRAEDVVANVWLKVVRGIDGLRDPGTVWAWICTIFNTTLTDLEGRDRSRHNEVRDEDVGELTEARTPDPDERILIEELLSIANDRERQVLRMHLEGHNPMEIARRLGVDESTVRHRITSMRQWIDQKRSPSRGTRKP